MYAFLRIVILQFELDHLHSLGIKENGIFESWFELLSTINYNYGIVTLQFLVELLIVITITKTETVTLLILSIRLGTSFDLKYFNSIFFSGNLPSRIHPDQCQFVVESLYKRKLR